MRTLNLEILITILAGSLLMTRCFQHDFDTLINIGNEVTKVLQQFSLKYTGYGLPPTLEEIMVPSEWPPSEYKGMNGKQTTTIN